VTVDHRRYTPLVTDGILRYVTDKHRL